MDINLPDNNWTKETELLMIRDFVRIGDINIIAKKYNKTVGDIELRIKKIIYENIEYGKSREVIASKFKISIDKVNEYYNSYKNIIESKMKKELFDKPSIHQSGGIDGYQQAIEEMKKEIVADTPVRPVVEENVDKLETIAKEIELRNKVMQLIIENKKLQEKIDELIENKKIDDSVKEILNIK